MCPNCWPVLYAGQNKVLNFVLVTAGRRVRRWTSATEPVLCGPLGGAEAQLSSASSRGWSLWGSAGEKHPAGDGEAVLRSLPWWGRHWNTSQLFNQPSCVARTVFLWSPMLDHKFSLCTHRVTPPDGHKLLIASAPMTLVIILLPTLLSTVFNASSVTGRMWQSASPGCWHFQLLANHYTESIVAD